MQADPKRPHEPPLPEALALFITWTTYGSWLPGDQRGWVRKGHGFREFDEAIRAHANGLMTEPPLALENDQRQLVEKTISDHCRIRKWTLHAVNCRVCHVHAVVTASLDPDDVRDQFKAWCTRKLKELQGSQGREVRQKWWTEGGSMRRIGDSESLEYVIHYVLDGQ